MPSIRNIALYLWVLFRMARPAQLLAISLVYLLGVLIALASGAKFNASSFLFGYLVIIPVSMSIHYANEYADLDTDRLTTRTPFSGGSGALPVSGLPRQLALGAAWVSLILGFGLAFLALMLSRLNFVTVAVLTFGAFFGWMYSLPPLKLAWRGWGELDNAMLGGVALPVYAYAAQLARVDFFIVLACLPFGLLAFNNLLATTWADREADHAVGKFTLATQWPRVRLRGLYLLVAALFVLLVRILMDVVLPPLVAVSSLLVLPIVIWGALTYTRWHNPLPSVAPMIGLLLAQLSAWWVLADFFPLLHVR